MPDERVSEIDALVAAGTYPSRASLITAAIDRLVAELESREIDRAIVEGYTRLPQTADDARWGELSALDSIREEPW